MNQLQFEKKPHDRLFGCKKTKGTRGARRALSEKGEVRGEENSGEDAAAKKFLHLCEKNGKAMGEKTIAIGDTGKGESVRGAAGYRHSAVKENKKIIAGERTSRVCSNLVIVGEDERVMPTVCDGHLGNSEGDSTERAIRARCQNKAGKSPACSRVGEDKTRQTKDKRAT